MLLVGLLLVSLAWLFLEIPARAGEVRIAEAPAGEELSRQFSVSVEGRNVPVYRAKVAPADEARRWKAMDDIAHSGEYFDLASFASFDLQGSVVVTVTCPEAVRSAKVLPASFGIEAAVSSEDAHTLSFTVAAPRSLTIEVNGDWSQSLHLFANPLETDVPRTDDPKVIYFGPGIHEVRQTISIGNDQTLYLADGAILRAIGPGGPVVALTGHRAALRGRGIIDGTGTPIHARSLVYIQGREITLEGVILRDCGHWNVPIRRSDQVRVSNLKVFGCRANSDGIDICNSRDVTVEGCFLRTLDDLVVVKSDKGQGEVHKVVVKNCVLWNQVAHALSIGAELRDRIDDVQFADCDVIHDKGREWTLRIYHCDAAQVSKVRFENIRVEESRRLISLWIGQAIWSKEPERGHIYDVLFERIHGPATGPKIELQGFDAEHAIENVTFRDVTLGGKAIAAPAVIANGFVRNVTIEPSAGDAR